VSEPDVVVPTALGRTVLQLKLVVVRAQKNRSLGV